MSRDRGSILIFTLWVLVILTILSIVLFRQASTDIKLARRGSDNLRATYLARAGIMKMIVELSRDNNAYDSLNEDWNRDRENPKQLTLGEDIVYYGASDEGRRLNLNSSALTEGQLIRLGIDEGLARHIIDYKTGKGKKGFEFMEELFLVESMTEAAYSRIKDIATIYRGDDPRVNINTASEEVLSIILMDDKLAREIIIYRQGDDGKEGTEDDKIFKGPGDISLIRGVDPGLFTVKSDVFRIWARASFDHSRVFKEIEAVVDRSGKIYHWKEL